MHSRRGGRVSPINEAVLYPAKGLLLEAEMRQCVVVAAEQPKWAWNPYSSGLAGCTSASECAANLRGGFPDDTQKLREAYRRELESLTNEHELLLLDFRELEERIHSAEGNPSSAPLQPPSEEVLFLKQGFDLRVQQFKEDCDRVERLRLKLQRSLERDQRANEEGGDSAGGKGLMSREAVAVNCTLLKRVKDQDRLIGILQRELEELQYEQALVENHLKKLRRAADHLPLAEQLEPRGSQPPPSLHSQGKGPPEFKSEWLKEIRFPRVKIPRLPTTKPPIPSAAVEFVKIPRAGSEVSVGRTSSPPARADRRTREGDEAKKKLKDSEGAEEGILPRAFKSLLSFAGIEEKREPERRRRDSEISLRVTAAREEEKPRGGREAEREVRAERRLSLARSFSALSVEGAAQHPYLRRASRTLPSPRERGISRLDSAGSVKSDSREEPGVYLAKRLASRTLQSPRERVRDSAEPPETLSRRASSVSLDPQDPKAFRRGSRTLLSPREAAREREAALERGASISAHRLSSGKSLTRAESAAFLSC